VGRHSAEFGSILEIAVLPTLIAPLEASSEGEGNQQLVLPQSLLSAIVAVCQVEQVFLCAIPVLVGALRRSCADGKDLDVCNALLGALYGILSQNTASSTCMESCVAPAAAAGDDRNGVVVPAILDLASQVISAIVCAETSGGGEAKEAKESKDDPMDRTVDAPMRAPLGTLGLGTLYDRNLPAQYTALRTCNNILRTVTRHVSAEVQPRLLGQVVDTFLACTDETADTFTALHAALVTAVVGACDKTVTPPRLDELVERMLFVAIAMDVNEDGGGGGDSAHPWTLWGLLGVEAAAQCLASLLNKAPAAGAMLPSLIVSILGGDDVDAAGRSTCPLITTGSIERLCAGDGSDDAFELKAERTVRVLAWVTKALVMRRHKASQGIAANALMAFLNGESLGVSSLFVNAMSRGIFHSTIDMTDDE